MNRYKAGQDAVVANMQARAAAADGKAAPVVLAAAVPEVSVEEIAIARTFAEAAGDIALNAAFPVDGGKQLRFGAEAKAALEHFQEKSRQQSFPSRKERQIRASMTIFGADASSKEPFGRRQSGSSSDRAMQMRCLALISHNNMKPAMQDFVSPLPP
jgi:hypothetical protein